MLLNIHLPPSTFSMNGVMPTLFRPFKNMEMIETRYLSGGVEKQYGASSLVQFEYQVTTTYFRHCQFNLVFSVVTRVTYVDSYFGVPMKYGKFQDFCVFGCSSMLRRSNNRNIMLQFYAPVSCVLGGDTRGVRLNVFSLIIRCNA